MKHLLAAIVLISLLHANPGGASVPKPEIITKAQWGSYKEGDFYQNQPFDPYCQGTMDGPVAITIHHTSVPGGTHPPNREQDMEKVRQIQRMHMSKGWGDVGYHFLIGSDGSIFQGRPIEYTGTHAPPNSHNIGISVIGDFETEEYISDLQINAVIRIASWLCDQYDIDPTSTISIFEQSNLAVCGHRDWGRTLCPGERLYALLPNIREKIRSGLMSTSPYDGRFSVNQFFPETILAGRPYDLTVTLRNTGFAAWTGLNLVSVESDSLKISEPAVSKEEIVNPLHNRSWQAKLQTDEPGMTKISMRMSKAEVPFGGELAWETRVVSPDAFMNGWLVAGPFSAESPDAAYATDYFEGEPLDILDITDEESEAAHSYSVEGDYRSGQRNYRGEDGERTSGSGRYYRGEEKFRLSLANYTGGDLVLRKRTDVGVRDQVAYAYINGRRLAFWRTTGSEKSRRWKDLDLVIPEYHVQGRQSMDVLMKAVGTKAWGCNSFMYTLLDSAEPLTAPSVGDKAGDFTWKSWKTDTGLVDLSLALPNAESGAVYLASYVRSPVTRRVEMRMGFPGFAKAWVNGKQAISGRGESDYPDTLRGDVVLQEGWNRVLAKVAVEPGAKDVYIRFCDRDGKPLVGLRTDFNPSETINLNWVVQAPRGI